MSTTTSTVPAWLYIETLPSLDSLTSTLLGTGAAPAVQLRFDASGRSASAGNSVRKLPAVPLTAVTLAAMPVAVAGIVQLPFAPHTSAVWVLSAAMGVERGPTFSGAGLVSIRRHGTIDTRAEAPELPLPPPNATCVAPMLAATMPPSTITRCALFMSSPFESSDVVVRPASAFGAHLSALNIFLTRTQISITYTWG